MNTPTLVAASTYVQFQLWVHNKSKSDYIFMSHNNFNSMLGYDMNTRIIIVMPDLTSDSKFNIFVRMLETKYNNIRWERT